LPPGVTYSTGPIAPYPDTPPDAVRPSVRFHVEGVDRITIVGWVATGQVVEGVLRPPLLMRILEAGTGGFGARSILVASATAHRANVTEVTPGVPAGRTLRGPAGEPIDAGRRSRDVPCRTGDVQLFP
jgi:hypothetical protein